MQEFVALAQAMVAGEATPAGPTPPELTSKQWSLLPPIVRDSAPSGTLGNPIHVTLTLRVEVLEV